MAGNSNSGRRSVKLCAIECLMEVQAGLQRLKYEHLEENTPRGELKTIVEDLIKTTKVTQEEIERIKVK